MQNIPNLISVGLVLFGASNLAAADSVLKNAFVRAEFDGRGLLSITDLQAGKSLRLLTDNVSLVVDGKSYASSNLPAPRTETGPQETTYHFRTPGLQFDVVYELRPGWTFISKQIRVRPTASETYRLNTITLFDSDLENTIESVYVPGHYLPQFGDHPPATSTKDYGMFLRFRDGSGTLLTAQSPFLNVERNGNRVALSYQPEMDWNPGDGAFRSDRGLLGVYTRAGRVVPARMTPEWKLPRTTQAEVEGADSAEISAFTRCVRAFLISPPERPSRVEVGWTLNDYQIDVATGEGRDEYKRFIEATAQLQIDHLLYGPANSEISNRDDSADDWKWEYVTWLGLGQKIRRGEWDVHKSELPASVRELVDYANSKNVGILAYVYPSLPYSGNASWLVPVRKAQEKGRTATLSSRAFQDHLIDLLITFAKRTGIRGYSFDYAFTEYPGTSAYAQWWGWRRVLEALRTGLPGIIIDGRQSYQLYGPWSWLAGSYPHPTGNDEQPESFTPFPDLHFDRVSADRQRYVAYWYRNYMFAPTEILPGYMTHQTERSRNVPEISADGVSRYKDDFSLAAYRQRDWDYLGWRYSVLSSIATAGWNNVIDMIPARDIAEFRNFSEEDKSWFRKWLDFTTQNRELLRLTMSILGPPAVGKVDGTAAITGDHGYVFLFNPNYERLSAEFRLDGSIGLSRTGEYVLREVDPVEGRLFGKPGSGTWSFGQTVSIPLQGTSAITYEISPAPKSAAPIVFNGTGNATIVNGILNVDGFTGEPGTDVELIMRLPKSLEVRSVLVNKATQNFDQKGDAVTVPIHVPGQRFEKAQQIELTPANDPRSSRRGTFTVPGRILRQLARRKKAWPIPWTDDDKLTTWLMPERLLLFVQIAEPDDRMPIKLTMDGTPVRLEKGYSSVREHAPSFVGWYADLSAIAPDQQHEVEVSVPSTLMPGQFRGLFFDNVEDEYVTYDSRVL